jgi:hypothetical protein
MANQRKRIAMSDRDRTALRADAERRVSELRAVARRLWPDRDDSVVNSELVSVLSELRQAERELRVVPTC